MQSYIIRAVTIGAAASGAAGASTGYLFQRPGLNSAGIKLLVGASLQGATTFVATYTTGYLGNAASKSDKRYETLICLVALTMWGLSTVVSKLVLGRLGSPISYVEAFGITGTANLAGFYTAFKLLSI